MKKYSPECPVCESKSIIKFNSYKHKCNACTDCNSVHHVKKSGRYLLEWFLPVRILSKILPRAAVLRLFHAPSEGFPPSEFYDGYTNKLLYKNPVKLSQVDQLLDIFDVNNIDIKNCEILDISGGPGIVASGLKDKCCRMVVTEYSQASVDAMNHNLGVKAVKFDYLDDNLENVVEGKFNIVLVRSSIIFCNDFEKLLQSISKVLHPGGHILIQTIVPTLGEVFWWQQMEYKFPIIYSQMAIERSLYRLGCRLNYGYREYGSYESVKSRSSNRLGLSGKLFTWLIDYPMVLAYYLIARKSKIPIDQSLRHKFLTQLWQLDSPSDSLHSPAKMLHFKDGNSNQSPDFYRVYNGYLNKLSNFKSKE
jgi:ubiquinone/menaquinone biosynthesis C-methylase UbiE